MLKFRYMTYTNFGLFESWYEAMAKKGWQIEKIILPFIHKFKKARPEEVKYKISLAPNEGTFAAFSKDELKEFDTMARDVGWHLIDRSFNMNLYKVDAGAETSLYNDNQEEIELLNKGIKGEILSLSLASLALVFITFYLFAGLFSKELYYSNYVIFMTPSAISLALFTILALVDYLSFRRRNKEAKAVKELSFSRFGFSRAYVLLVLIPLILTPVAWITGSLLPLGNFGGFVALVSILPSLLILAFIYFFRKKIKTMNIKRGNKRLILIFMIAFMFLATNILTLLFVSKPFITKQSGRAQKQEEDLGKFVKTSGRRSFLTQSCDYYSSKTSELDVTKTVVKSQGLAEDLFAKIVKESKNHPDRAAYVRDLSNTYPYDKTYRLASEDSYVILYKNVVLEINGDLADSQVQKEIASMMGV